MEKGLPSPLQIPDRPAQVVLFDLQFGYHDLVPIELYPLESLHSLLHALEEPLENLDRLELSAGGAWGRLARYLFFCSPCHRTNHTTPPICPTCRRRRNQVPPVFFNPTRRESGVEATMLNGPQEIS
jgi:hypothetical protein